MLRAKVRSTLISRNLKQSTIYWPLLLDNLSVSVVLSPRRDGHCIVTISTAPSRRAPLTLVRKALSSIAFDTRIVCTYRNNCVGIKVDVNMLRLKETKTRAKYLVSC